MCRECSSLDLWDLPKVWTPEQLYLATQSIRDMEKLKAKIMSDQKKTQEKAKGKTVDYSHIRVHKHLVKEAL